MQINEYLNWYQLRRRQISEAEMFGLQVIEFCQNLVMVLFLVPCRIVEFCSLMIADSAFQKVF